MELSEIEKCHSMGFYVSTVGQGKGLRYEVNCKKCCIPVAFDIKKRDEAYNKILDGKVSCHKFDEHGYHQMAFTTSEQRDYVR